MISLGLAWVDLGWLGLAWLGLYYPQPIRCQSHHIAYYSKKLQQLREEKLIYPAFLTCGEVHHYITQQSNANTWSCDPDGTPLYPIFERDLPENEVKRRIKAGKSFAWRLNM